MYNFFGDQQTMFHDGIDPRSANDLKGEERKKGEEMLIKSMKNGSFWAPMGLREMGSKKAIPIMKDVIDKSEERVQLEIAHALNVLEGTSEYIPYILRVLKDGGSWNRMLAAIMLRSYNSLEVIEALFDAIEDGESPVRTNSFTSLLRIHDVPRALEDYEEILSEILVYYGLDDETHKEAIRHYKKASKMIRELINKESVRG